VCLRVFHAVRHGPDGIPACVRAARGSVIAPLWSAGETSSSYKSPTEARVAEGATIVGPITFDRIPEREARQARTFPTGSSVLFALHLFVGGLLVIFLLPRLERRLWKRCGPGLDGVCWRDLLCS
jgi:hypothetical protein